MQEGGVEGPVQGDDPLPGPRDAKHLPGLRDLREDCQPLTQGDCQPLTQEMQKIKHQKLGGVALRPHKIETFFIFFYYIQIEFEHTSSSPFWGVGWFEEKNYIHLHKLFIKSVGEEYQAVEREEGNIKAVRKNITWKKRTGEAIS